MMRGLLLGSVASLAMSLGACTSARCPAVRFSSSDELTAHHASVRAWAGRLRAEARVDRRDGGDRVRGTVFMMLERPDRVRFDAMTQFGPAAVLTSDGASFALTDLRENRFFAGPTCAENIARLLGMPLEAEDLARLLVGEAPERSFETPGEGHLDCESGQYVIETTDPASGRVDRRVYDVRQADVEGPLESQRLRVREHTRHAADGTLEYRVRWDDYRFVEDLESSATPREGLAMAFRVQFEIPPRGIDTLVRFESIELNPTLESNVFVQDARDGLTIERVECEGE